MLKASKIFGNGAGRRYKFNAAYLADRPERGRYNFHSLRHAAASLFIAHLNWTPKRVQVVMGHSSIQMTFDLYGHLYEDKDADREAMKKVEAAIAAA